MTIFINGKQKRVKRPPTIDGIPVEEFVRRNADPVWLLENEMYEELHEVLQETNQDVAKGARVVTKRSPIDSDEELILPF